MNVPSGERLEQILRELQTSEASGILRVVSEGTEKLLHFRRGRIVAVRCDGDSGAPAAGGQREILLSILEARGSEIRFEQGAPEDPVPSPELDLAPQEALLESFARSSRVIRWAPRPPVPFEETTLSTRESALIDLLKAPPSHHELTPSEIAALSPLPQPETLQILQSLLATGVLELGEPGRGEDLTATRAGADAPASWAASYHENVLPRTVGRFVVERALGRGSMGAVLLARDPAIDRVVAIKLVQSAGHLSPSQREKYRERFYREASAAGQLLHPSIATVFDVGHTEDGTPFIVMEHIKGLTLRDLLESDGLTLAQTLRIARDVLEALSFAHAQGIVHRDIKPGNVMVTPDFRAKIMDFGIAHVVGSELTAADDVLGSPYYMAPEQLSKGAIGPTTDLFAFAVVLYRMLTGALPFTGDSFAAIAQAILQEEPRPPEELAPGIPKGLSRLVLRCLEKAPEDRFSSASEVLRTLSAIQEGRDAVDEGRKAPTPAGGDRWPAVALALVLAGFLVFRIAVPGPDAAPPEAPASSELAAPEPAAPPPEIAAYVTSSVPAPLEPPAKPAPPKRRPEPEPREVESPPEPEAGESLAEEPAPAAPTEAELFYEARLALERGELGQSRRILEVLLARAPTFAGAAELHLLVSDQIWEGTLPRVLDAKHDHRIGGCAGELSLASLGIRFQSDAHDWAFERENIRVLERTDPRTLTVETFEKDLLSLGKNKRYKFELDEPLSDSDWDRYQRLLK